MDAVDVCNNGKGRTVERFSQNVWRNKTNGK